MRPDVGGAETVGDGAHAAAGAVKLGCCSRGWGDGSLLVTCSTAISSDGDVCGPGGTGQTGALRASATLTCGAAVGGAVKAICNGGCGAVAAGSSTTSALATGAGTNDDTRGKRYDVGTSAPSTSPAMGEEAVDNATRVAGACPIDDSSAPETARIRGGAGRLFSGGDQASLAG